VGNRATSPERSGRLYFNEGFEDNPASAPIAMRAVSAAFMRRAELTRSTDDLVSRINEELGERHSGSAAPPNGLRRPEQSEELQPDTHVPRRRKLGGTALEAIGDEAA
jgi:hypothetical protein